MSNGNGQPTPARSWEECRVDVYHRLGGLEGWTRMQGDRCDRLHGELDAYLDAEHEKFRKEIGTMRERLTSLEARVLFVIGIASAIFSFLGHVIARAIQ